MLRSGPCWVAIESSSFQERAKKQILETTSLLIPPPPIQPHWVLPCLLPFHTVSSSSGRTLAPNIIHRVTHLQNSELLFILVMYFAIKNNFLGKPTAELHVNSSSVWYYRIKKKSLETCAYASSQINLANEQMVLNNFFQFS